MGMSNMAFRDEVDDGFDAVLFLEDSCYQKGHNEGFGDGKKIGLQEGRQLGIQKGCEISGEVGFYLGFVSIWLEILKESSHAKPRCVKVLETLKTMISALPVTDPSNVKLFEDLEKVRAKFKQVCSLLRVSAEYSGGVTGQSF